jgi:predicted dehydrogenase/nucleoside-diphosphate-sugar epimerase
VIGAGHVSRYHLQALRRLTNVRLVGVCDVDAARAEAAAREAATRAFASAGELLEAGADVVHVLTPPATHAALTIQALDHGCHVVVEKPLATSVEECDLIEDAARRAGKCVSVQHSLLRDRFVSQALDLARRGALGEVTGVDYRRASDYPPYVGGPPPVEHGDGGYPWRDLGVHALYLLRELLGEIEGVDAVFADSGASGRRAKRNPGILYDEWRALVRCARGHGHVHLSWNAEPLQHVLTVHGTHGTLRADLFSMAVTTRKATPLPRVLERPLSALGEAAQVWAQVPLNAVRFLRGGILPYHGVQTMVAEFYERLGRDTSPSPLVSVAEARPIVEWTERVAREADASKEKFLARFPPVLSARVAVTGATGVIGRRLVARLLAENVRVRILARREPLPELMNDPRVEVVYGDLGDPDAVDRAVAGTDLVFHLGAAMHGGPHDFTRGTVAGTRNVVESVLRRGARLVHVSSLSVLHFAATRRTETAREDWPLEPHPEARGHYARSKLQAETLVRDASRTRGLRAIVLRPGQVFGGGAPLLTPAVARRLGDRLVILGNGTVALPLVYVDDVVDALLAAARRPSFDGSVFHIVDSGHVTQNQLARHAARDARIVHVPLPLVDTVALIAEGLGRLLGLGRGLGLSRYRVRSALAPLSFDCTAAREGLGWQPRIGVKRGLEITGS